MLSVTDLMRVEYGPTTFKNEKLRIGVLTAEAERSYESFCKLKWPKVEYPWFSEFLVGIWLF